MRLSNNLFGLLFLISTKICFASLVDDEKPVPLTRKIQCSSYIFHVRFIGMKDGRAVKNEIPDAGIIDEKINFTEFEIIEILKSNGNIKVKNGEKYLGGIFEQTLVKYATKEYRVNAEFIAFFEGKITGRGSIGQWDTLLPSRSKYEPIEKLQEIKLLLEGPVGEHKNCSPPQG